LKHFLKKLRKEIKPLLSKWQAQVQAQQEQAQQRFSATN
jgi:hypothetical protein